MTAKRTETRSHSQPVESATDGVALESRDYHRVLSNLVSTAQIAHDV